MTLERKPRVFQAPTAMPMTIQMLPSTRAWLLKFHHNTRHTRKPAAGSSRFMSRRCSARQ